MILDFHHSGAKNKKILTSISVLVGSPFKPLEGIVGCFTLTAHSESSQPKRISPPTFGRPMTLLTFYHASYFFLYYKMNGMVL